MKHKQWPMATGWFALGSTALAQGCVESLGVMDAGFNSAQSRPTRPTRLEDGGREDLGVPAPGMRHGF